MLQNHQLSILKSFKALCVMLVALSMMWPAVLRAQDHKLGFCEERVITHLPVKDAAVPGAALHFDSAFMQAYAGNRISAVRVALNAPIEGQVVRVFISSSLEGEPLYEQTFTDYVSGWNTLTLATPFEIDGSALYIGYEAPAQKYLLYNKVFVSGEEWNRLENGPWTRYTDDYSAALQALVQGDCLPANNIHLSQMIMPEYVTTTVPVYYRGTIKNLGTETVKSVTIDYLVDGQVKATSTIEGLRVQPRKAGSVSFKAPLFEAEGQYNVQLKVSAVNGQPDAMPFDNETPVSRVLCRKQFAKRKALLELFSTEKCTACPAAHKSLISTLGNRSDVVWLGHHAGFYVDKFTVEESVEYEWFYADCNMFAPAMMVDRSMFADKYPLEYSYEVPMVSAGGELASKLLDEALKVPAFTDIHLSSTYQADTRNLEVTVNGSQLLPLDNPEQARLYVWLTEDGISSDTQAGAEDGYKHYHVARKSLTPAWGEVIDLPSGFSQTYRFQLPEVWVSDKVKVVAFVGLYNPSDKKACKVLNAEQSALGAQSAVGSVHSDECHAAYADVYSIDGKCVMKQASMADLDRLPRGVYIYKGHKWVK